MNIASTLITVGSLLAGAGALGLALGFLACRRKQEKRVLITFGPILLIGIIMAVMASGAMLPK